MDYEQLYKEALERANEIHNVDMTDSPHKEIAEYIFPVLKESESEDEKIRHAIDGALQNKTSIEYLNALGVTFQDAHNWLEKQGEKTNPYSGVSFEYNGHIWGMCARDNGVEIWLDEKLLKHLEKQETSYTKKDVDDAYVEGMAFAKDELEKQNKQILANSAKTCKDEQKPTDNNKPKFEVGDWINGYYASYKVLSVNNKGYAVEDTDGNKINILFENEKFHHLWTIQDTKKGDIIYIKKHKNNSEWLLIFKKIKSQNNYIDVYDYYAFSITTDNVYHDFNGCWGLLYDGDIVRPATKEQCNLLFAKMKEEGYEWDAEEKDLKKVKKERPLLSDFFKSEYERGKVDAIKRMENVWSEEDEKEWKSIVSVLTRMHFLDELDWLRSKLKR